MAMKYLKYNETDWHKYEWKWNKYVFEIEYQFNMMNKSLMYSNVVNIVQKEII